MACINAGNKGGHLQSEFLTRIFCAAHNRPPLSAGHVLFISATIGHLMWESPRVSVKSYHIRAAPSPRWPPPSVPCTRVEVGPLYVGPKRPHAQQSWMVTLTSTKVGPSQTLSLLMMWVTLSHLHYRGSGQTRELAHGSTACQWHPKPCKPLAGLGSLRHLCCLGDWGCSQGSPVAIVTDK